MKRCIDCKFSRYNPVYYYYACDRLRTSKVVEDPVQGGTKVVDTSPLNAYRRADDERSAWAPWKCGQQARYFKPKANALT